MATRTDLRKVWSGRVLALLLCVPVIAVAAMLAIAHFRGEADRQREATLVLSQLRADAYRQNGLEWQAIAEGELDERGGTPGPAASTAATSLTGWPAWATSATPPT